MDYAFGAVVIAAALFGAAHAVIYKRESRSAALWLLVILLLPAAGPVLYVLFGLNRVQRRAKRMRRRSRDRPPPNLEQTLPGTQLAPLARLVSAVAERPLVEGNAVEPLIDGKEAFPAMLAAVDGAKSSVALASYIFHRGGIGARFVEALGAAQRRGVAVRVLIDDVSDRLSFASPARPLRRAGVPVGVFNRTFVPARFHAMHLRNHRKILVVDGQVGFTGGFNIDERYWGEGAYRDVHFRLRGPVVNQLMDVFAEDWEFATDERLSGAPWFCVPETAGRTITRVLDAGPDESYERVRWAYLGGLGEARRSVRICTPYFLPDQALISALNAAALRGVEVDIVVPLKSDLPHVQWAVTHHLWQVVERGCRVWWRPPPFDHSKLMVVDSEWTLFGSANWDARSLRLNFELDVECYDRELGRRVDELIRARRSESRPVTLGALNARSLPVKLRDGVARLFAPLL